MKPEITALLEQLKPIALPEPIGFELALGWILLFGIILVTVGTIWYFKNKKTSIKKLAFNELDEIEKEFKKDKNYKTLATACNLLLRNYCQIKKITINQDFLKTLDNITPIPEEIKSVLATNLYKKSLTFNADDLIDYCGEVIYKMDTQNV
jgi:hypothetical protein